ncbi:MAG TPA: MjaI family restriction endonuclease, partial [Euryarchaeota archaeon]|nr:MjaI family restriction endonuclease [Euryarchaeota archaeon]
QEAILKKAAEIKGVDYRLSDNTDESKGIDGYIGDIPVSIKPDTYKVKRSLSENIDVKIIYYKKVKDGIEVDYGEIS